MASAKHHNRDLITHRVIPAASSSLIRAALHVLSDGRARSAGEILSGAVKANLLPANTRKITLYTSLSQYVQRSVAHRRRPLIVQDETTHSFRINHAVDDWPDVSFPTREAAVSESDIDTIASRLRAAARGSAPDAFEKNVCEAFAILGFVTTHVGGIGAPDGFLDAPLGPLAYRAIVECKTAQGDATVNAPRLEEPAKFRETYHAKFAVLVGPAFSVDAAFESEMQIHGVSVWSIDDIVNAIRLGVDPLECHELFAAGIAEDRLADLAWARLHGAQKRLAVIASLLHATAWDAQKALVGQVDAAEAPALTVDTALFLVDTALRDAKASGGATREEVETAIADLIRSGAATKLADRDGLVICRPPTS